MKNMLLLVVMCAGCIEIHECPPEPGTPDVSPVGLDASFPWPDASPVPEDASTPWPDASPAWPDASPIPEEDAGPCPCG